MNDAINSHQTRGAGTSRNYLKQTIPIIFLLIILFFSAWVRFDGITEQGIFGGDNFRYIAEAKLWAEGQPPKFCRVFYRPVSYFLQGMAIKIFGYNDYSIKMLHGIIDMISIFLIFMIAFILAGDLWAGVVSSLIYAFLPKVIFLARVEMVHAESTFFGLLALFFFILFAGKKTKNSLRFFLLFISGFSLGLAANTHGDLAFLAPGYVLYLFIKSYNSQNKRKFLKEFLILAAIFTFSFFSPYFLGFLIFGTKKVLQVFFSELLVVQSSQGPIYGRISHPLVFIYIFYYFFKYYFIKQAFLIGLLSVGTIFIIIYRKKKKENNPLLAYLPLFLIFSYTLLYSCFFDMFAEFLGRYIMHLLPLVIFIIILWYYKIFKQLFGKYSLIVFLCLSLILFLVNPKVMPGKTTYKSRYRLIYDILKDDVNWENKLLIAPAAIYSFDSGYQCDLYFGKDSIYMVDLPIKDKYDLNTLQGLLKNMNIRYIFLGNTIEPRFFRKESYLGGKYRRWFRNDKNPYSLEKDLEIIRAYIQSKGGFVVNENRFGKIYHLTGEKPVQEKSGLIANGSFERWWKGFPAGEWIHVSGKISRSGEATDGLSSMRFDPPPAGDKTGVRIAWALNIPLHEEELKLKVRLDAKAGKSDWLFFFFNATIDGKRRAIKPGVVKYTGTANWDTLSEDFVITPGMKNIIFHLGLRPGASEPALIDNLSIIPVRQDLKKIRK